MISGVRAGSRGRARSSGKAAAGTTTCPAPGRAEDDLCTRVPGVPSHAARKTRNISVLLRTMAAAPAQFPADAGQGPEFLCVRMG